MGERKLAPVMAMKAVAAACQESIGTMIEPVDEAMQVRTPGGVFAVRWDERGSATALGQMAFFAECTYSASPRALGGHRDAKRCASAA